MDKCKLGVVTEKRLKEWFPEVFEVKLEAGKWYKDIDGSNYLVFVTIAHGGMNTNNSIEGYGFNRDGVFKKWNTNNLAGSNDIRLAATEEVTEALKKEAVRRGIKLGAYIVRDFDDDLKDVAIDTNSYPGNHIWFYHPEDDYLEHYGFVVYSKGRWAEIIPTKTIQEAEKLLKELGHEIKIV